MLRTYPITLAQANAFVKEHHRHHKPVTGHRFSVAAADLIDIRGVAIAGRPVSPKTDQRFVVEVYRVCVVEGCPNVCSFLYARSARVAEAFGARVVQTFIRDDETGASLLAAGWVRGNSSPAKSWNQPGRPREDKTEIIGRTRFYKELRP